MSASFCDCVNQWEQVLGLQVLKDTNHLSVRTRRVPNEISKLLGAPLMSEITTIINLTCILCELDKRLFQEMQISTVVKYNMMNLQDTPHQQPSRRHSWSAHPPCSPDLGCGSSLRGKPRNHYTWRSPWAGISPGQSCPSGASRTSIR